MGFFGPVCGPLGASSESLGSVMGPLVGFLGACWRSGASPGAGNLGIVICVPHFLAPLATLLGPSWAVLGASWAVLGLSWAVLGLAWEPLGPSWSDIEGFLGRLGRCVIREHACAKHVLSFEIFIGSYSGALLLVLSEPSWAVLRPSWLLWSPSGRVGALFEAVLGCAVLGGEPFGPSWSGLGSLLVRLGRCLNKKAHALPKGLGRFLFLEPSWCSSRSPLRASWRYLGPY